MDNTAKKIFKGSFILGAGAFLSKLIGAVYRIPLTRIIGAEGLGLYQLVFPVYTLLLDFSGAGATNAIAKLIGESKEGVGDNSGKILKASLLTFGIIGLFFTVITLILSETISAFQGNSDVALAYKTLSPSVFLVCLISCFRGYFQGKTKTVPTAVSQIAEQIVKLCLGLTFSYIFMPDIIKAVSALTLAITVSELISLIYLIVTYALYKRKSGFLSPVKINGTEYRLLAKRIFVISIPVTLTGMLLPLSKVADSFIIVNCLSVYSENATAQYGILSGAVYTVIGLPVAVCYGISAVAVPCVARSENGKKDVVKLTLLFTLSVSFFCALVCYFFAPLIIKILFRSFGTAEYLTAVDLLKKSSPCIVLMCLLQTFNGILIGKGKSYRAVFALGVGILVKTVVEIITLNNPSINLSGAVYAAIACYFVANLINLFTVLNLSEKRKRKSADKAVRFRGYPDTE